MEALVADADSVVVSSICLPEIISTLTRLRREKRLDEGQYQKCKTAAVSDFNGFEVRSISSQIVQNCIEVLEQADLRAMDALHVATALEAEVDRFVSSDRRQLAAAQKFRLTVTPV